MVEVQAGQAYFSRRGTRVKIVDINPGNALFSFSDEFGAGYRSNGQFAFGDEPNPEDLIDLAPDLLDKEEISVGEIVAYMEDHKPASGTCVHWPSRGSMFEITSDMYFDMVKNALPKVRRGDLIMNKYAYVVAKPIIGQDDKISAVLVVYRNDTTFHCATLWAR